MAITEESRFELHQRLREVLGEGPGTTLMEHLPPANFATTQDVAAVKDDVLAEVAAVKDDVAAVKQDVLAVKQDVLAVKQDVAALKHDVERLDGRLSERIETLDGRLSERIVSLDERLTQRMDTMATSADVKELRGDIYRVLTIQTISLVMANAAVLGAAAAFFGGR